MQIRSLLVSPLLLGSTLVAQVGYGETIVSNFSNAAPMEGLLKVNRNGTVTPVTGLALTARGSNEINAIQLDPIDNRVWIGGINGSAGRVDRFTVSATNTVANFAAAGVTGLTTSVSGIAFDANGNLIASSGTIGGTGGLFRFDRKTGVVTRIGGTWTGVVGTANAVCSDPQGTLYFAVVGVGAPIYRLDPGPNGDYPGPAVLVGNAAPPSSSTTISSVEYAPANGARPARVWWTTFGSAGTAVGYVPATGGAGVPAGPLGGNSAPNWIDYDALNDDFVLVTGGINPDTIYKVDHAGAPTQIAVVPPGGVNGSPSANDANDIVPATTTILPQYVPAAGLFDLELGTACKPGTYGGILITAPVGILIIAAQAGPDGRIFVKLPNLAFPRGSSGSITFQSICFDPAAGFTFGPKQAWPRN